MQTIAQRPAPPQSSHQAAANAAKLQHGYDYSGQDITGWHISEKLNGCRAYWDGQQLFSKSGRVINAPRITAQLPAGLALDGELYAGRSNFESARLLTQYGKDDGSTQFIAFDAPGVRAAWPERLAQAIATGVKTVAPLRCPTPEDVAQALRQTLRLGGEGLMARRPNTLYKPGRSSDVLKLKSAAFAWLPADEEVAA